MDDIYQEQIVDHYKNPRNFGELPDADPSASSGQVVRVRESNASCGDMVEVAVRFGKDGEISDVRFKGVGCAISMASTSMLLDKIKTQKLKSKEIGKWGEKDMEKLLGVKVSATREKCVMLGLRAVKRAVEEEND